MNSETNIPYIIGFIQYRKLKTTESWLHLSPYVNSVT